MPLDKIVPAAEALYEGGIRLMEITFDQADPECLRLTPRMIEKLNARFPDMLVGAGTVMTRAQARAAADAGAGGARGPPGGARRGGGGGALRAGAERRRGRDRRGIEVRPHRHSRRADAH